MKKFFAFALVASMMSLAACSEKKAETTSTDSTTMSVDTTMAVDTAAVADTAATMSADTTK
jgi:lipoprotein NlpI